MPPLDLNLGKNFSIGRNVTSSRDVKFTDLPVSWSLLVVKTISWWKHVFISLEFSTSLECNEAR